MTARKRIVAPALGIDIGGTRVKFGEVTPDGAVRGEAEIDSPEAAAPEALLDALAAAAGRLLGSRRPARVGVGCAGLVDSARGIVHLSPNLPRWREVPLGALLAQRLDAPVRVLNDANAFALAEARVGAGAGASPLVALTLGTGVGGAIVVDGRLQTGRHGFAGEIGHLSLVHDGPACPCGNRGCLELYVGRRPLVAAYRRVAVWAPGERGYDLAGGDPAALTPRLICTAAERGEGAARETFAQCGRMLGAALANLTNLLDPERFVIGGGLAQAGPWLLDPAREILAARAMIGRAGAPPVVAAALGVRAGMIGAGLYAYEAAGWEGGGGCA